MKIVFRLSVVLLLLTALAFGALFYFKTADQSEAAGTLPESEVRFIQPENEHPYLIKTYSDGSWCADPFTVVTFTDTHLSGESRVVNGETLYSPGDMASLTLIENTIKLEKPDLVVITGDIAVGKYGETGARRLAALFEKYNQYWGYVLGNHDGENSQGPSRNEFVKIYAEYKHCIISEDSPELYGDGNCIVNVKNGYGEVIQSLVFIDSGDYVKQEFCDAYGFEYTSGYDFLKYDQIEWYKSELNLIARQNGRMPKSIMFLHIPLKEFGIAHNAAMKADTVLYGEKREPECDSPFNTGMFDAILELGSTQSVVVGHDHTNDYCVDYKGVKLLYSQSSSFNSYYLRSNVLLLLALKNRAEYPFNDGHTEFVIGGNGTATITPKLNQKNPALFDGLPKEYRDELYLTQTLPNG